MKLFRNLFCILFFLSAVVHAKSQIYRDDTDGAILNGVLKQYKDITIPVPYAKIVLKGTDYETYSDGRGFFIVGKVKGAGGPAVLQITADGYEPLDYDVVIGDGVELGMIFLHPLRRDINPITINDLMPSMPEQGGMLSDIGGTALFWNDKSALSNGANLGLGLLGYKMRGYDWQYSEFYINGAPMNEPESGYAFAGLFAGLNGLTNMGEGTSRIVTDKPFYGDIGGYNNIWINPLRHKKLIKASYSFSNSLFTNQFAASYSSGIMDNGWAVSAMLSARNGNGFVKGTNYSGYSYLFTAGKEIDEDNDFSVFIMGTPTERGMINYATEEVYDLIGNKHYNSAWGEYDGSKRNSRINKYHQPVMGFMHNWDVISETASLRTSLTFSFGKNEETGLNWADYSLDPTPDRVSNLDNFLEQPQLDWYKMYESNRGSTNANYIVENKISDRSMIAFNTVLDVYDWKNFETFGGIDAKIYNGRFYKQVDDLLGGASWLDIGTLKLSPIDGIRTRYSADVSEGQAFGYDYGFTQQSVRLWNLWKYYWRNFKITAGGSVGVSGFSYTSNMADRNEDMQSSSRCSFFNYSGKLGIAYLLDRQSNVELNIMYSSRPPLFSDVYLAPRVANIRSEDIQNEKIMGAELNYVFQNTSFTLELSGFFTRMDNQVRTRSYFDNDYSSYMNLTLSSFGQQHMGGELNFKYRMNEHFSAYLGTAYGIYKYNTDADVVLFRENTANKVVRDTKINLSETHVAGTPQLVTTLGALYDARKWWAGISMNYAANNYLEENFLANILTSANDIESNPIGLEEEISSPHEVPQQTATRFFTINLNGGYTFEFAERKYALGLNLNVQNVLNSTGAIGGYVPFGLQSDTNSAKFNPRYAYAYGRTFFVTLSFRF